MAHSDDDRRLEELDLLRAPPRGEAERRAARERVLASAELPLGRRRRVASSWEVLAAWGRPGLVAASIVLAILAGTLQPWREWRDETQPVALSEVLRGAGASDAIPELLVALAEPDADAVVAAALTERNGNGAGAPDDFEQR